MFPRRTTVVALGLVLGCSEPQPRVVDQPGPEAPEPRPAVEPEAPAPERPASAGPLRVEVTLAAGSTCTLVLEAASVEDRAEARVVTGISKVSVEESKTCAAATLYKADPGGENDGLEGGSWVKPGQQGNPEETPGIALIDMNFDGYLDLTIVRTMGMKMYTHEDWLFVPKSRSFAASPDLVALSWPQFDAKTKTITTSGESAATYRWVNGKLVEKR